MKKKVRGKDVYFSLAWSPLYKYDKYTAIKILPETPGIICLLEKITPNRMDYLIFYNSWRDGCRVSMKKLLDPILINQPLLIKDIDHEKIYYKYTVAEGQIDDIRDIMYWLIKTYKPKHNRHDIEDSKRYKNIYIRESVMKRNDIVEKIRDLPY